MVDSNTSSVFSTLALGVIVFVVIYLIFELSRKRFADVYTPSLQKGLVKTTSAQGEKGGGVPIPSPGFGGWIKSTWCVSDDTVYEVVGMDGYVYLRFLKMCFTVMLYSAILGNVIGLAVYGTSSAEDDAVHGINYYSLTNIPAGNDRLWTPWILTYFFTLIFLYHIYKEYENFALRRAHYLKHGDSFISKQTSYSVLVENIPSKYVSADRLFMFFNLLFPGKVLYTSVAIDVCPLDACLHYRETMMDQLERNIAKFEASKQQDRPTVDTGSLFTKATLLCNSKAKNEYKNETVVDGIDYYNDQLDILNEEVTIYQMEAIRAEEDMNFYLTQGGKNAKKALVQAAIGGGKGKGKGKISIADIKKAKGANNKEYSEINRSSSSAMNSGNGSESKDATDHHGGAGSLELVQLEEGHGGNGSANVSREGSASGGSPAHSATTITNSIKEASNHLKESVENTNKVDKTVERLVYNKNKDDISERITMKHISHTGFVTFNSRQAQLVATQLTFLSEDFPNLKVTNAPSVSDIIWDNIGADTTTTERVSFIVSALYTTGLLFWGVILTFIAGLSNLSTLESILPFLVYLDTAALSILQGLLPVIVLIVFMALIPIIMNAVAIYVERRKTYSEVQREVFQWYYLYQLANVYIILLAGSLINSATDIANDPASGVGLIARAVPTTSTFFLNYCITSLCIGIPIALLQIKPFLFYVILRKYFFKEEHLTRRRMIENILAPIELDYGTTLPATLYILTIGLLYWVIAPLVLIAVCLIFGGCYLVMKYQYLYIFIRKFESGGEFWYGLYKFSMISLMISMIIIIAYFFIKEGFIQGGLLIPLAVFIYFFWGYTQNRFYSLSQVTPFSSALKLDLTEQGKYQKGSKEYESFEKDYYRQPALKAATKLEPYPYRLANEPLIREDGSFNPTYYKDVPTTIPTSLEKPNEEERIAAVNRSQHDPNNNTAAAGAAGGGRNMNLALNSSSSENTSALY
jgi:hypothetical protein